MHLTIAIPAFNRPSELSLTLDSIKTQVTVDTEILVIEDNSPRQLEVEEVVRNFSNSNPSLQVRYLSNNRNTGYDGNLRNLIINAKGKYIFFLGDDDIVCKGAIRKILTVTSDGSIGVVLRAWQSFDTKSGVILDTHRYFKGDRVFEPGKDALIAFFRRSVFISGLTIHRESALKINTNIFDGKLLYQLYLVGKILMNKRGYYIDNVLVKRRCGSEFFFGSAEEEQGKYIPNILRPEHSLRFVSDLLSIAKYLDSKNLGIYKGILIDLSRYSYPLLSIQYQNLNKIEFIGYGLNLGRLGLSKSILFWVYFACLIAIGKTATDRILSLLKRLHGATPIFSGAAGNRTSN